MNYHDKNVRCPFYFCDSDRTIKCESEIAEQSENVFATKAAKKEHFKKFCCAEYKKCEHEKNLEKKYNSEVT